MADAENDPVNAQQDPEPITQTAATVEDTGSAVPAEPRETARPEAPEIPAEVTADYANEHVRAALRTLLETPDYEHLAAFLTALREGYLVIDVTGTSSKRKGPRVRTIRSTQGQLVLPVFTSMAELRAMSPGGRAGQMKGAVLPAREALGLISTDRFVAAEFDKAGASLVMLRKYIALVAGDDPITAETVEAVQ